MTITLAAESPLSEDVRGLIAQLNATLLALTPAEYCSHMTVEQMAGPYTTVFVAREKGAAVACGALRRHAGGVGEVKRMYTEPAFQSRGIGARILGEIEALARREGLQRLVLETGHRMPPPGGFTNARALPVAPRCWITPRPPTRCSTPRQWAKTPKRKRPVGTA
jgi:putative acetyltransferase